MTVTERWTIEGSNFSADRLTRVSGPVLGPRARARVVLQSDFDALAAQLQGAVAERDAAKACFALVIADITSSEKEAYDLGKRYMERALRVLRGQ